MAKLVKPLYCPALRMKAGELAGVRELAVDVAALTLPRFIVPPVGERDEATAQLFTTDDTPDISGVLTKHWGNRSAFIDMTYLIDERGRDCATTWLPQIFERAGRAGAGAVPIASLADLEQEECVAAFRAAASLGYQLKLGIWVSWMSSGPELMKALSKALARLGLSPNECAIVADFHDADFSNPSFVAPVISGALEALQDFGQWHYIIFQGTNFPEKNPAGHGSRILWPRNEWTAWREAVQFDPSTAEHMIFGDYAADCAKIAFDGGSGRAIRHYRYATEREWVVERGEAVGYDKQIMQRVCRNVVDSGHFAGAGFSAADAYIFSCANYEGGPGNSTTWRQVNTTHHITRVVADVGKVRGLKLSERQVVTMGRQLALFG